MGCRKLSYYENTTAFREASPLKVVYKNPQVCRKEKPVFREVGETLAQSGGSDFSNSKLALGTGGLLYGLGETAVTPGSQWLGNNGKYYSKSWGGNQYTGSRAGALNASKAYRIAGRLTFAAGAFISGYEGYNHLRAGNYAGFSKSGLDIGMGAVGFLGPIGLAVSAGYFIIDSTIGWNNAFQSLDRTTQYNQSILGSGWSPFRMEGGLK